MIKHDLTKINGYIPKKVLKDLYLDYVNNYLTVEKFARDYNLTKNQTIALISNGKKITQGG